MLYTWVQLGVKAPIFRNFFSYFQFVYISYAYVMLLNKAVTFITTYSYDKPFDYANFYSLMSDAPQVEYLVLMDF